MEYFAPAVQLGLTATPKRRDNIDTYAYFGEPVFVYSLKDGINDGYLTPFKAEGDFDDAGRVRRLHARRPTGGRRRGGWQGLQGRGRDPIIEIKEREGTGSVVPARYQPDEKTLVFLRYSRARPRRARPGELRRAYIRTTANVGGERRRIEEQHCTSRTTEKTIPTVLTTSQKLSTGVDARNVCNIVLMRPVT
ncbi:MAG: hypothetical protein U0S12_08640 [Fimbriimonadales bacterium]